MAKIKIKRSSEYNNKMRAIKILVDGKQIGTIADGETKEFTTSEGAHKIEAKIDWCGSPEVLFTVKDAEIKYFNIESFSQKNKFFNSIYLVLVITVLHFVLAQTIDFHYTFLLILPTFFLLLYHLTVGRKKYLTLKKMDYGV